MRTLMVKYKRNIKRKLLLIRLALVGLVVAGIILTTSGLDDYAFVLMTLLAVGSIFPISDLYIDDNTIVVKQYFLYGLIPRITTFLNADNISMDAFEIEMNNAATWADFETDSLTSPLTEKKYILKSQDILGKTKKAKLKLSNEERSLINSSFIDKALPIT